MDLISRRRFLSALSTGAVAAGMPGQGRSMTAVAGFRQGVAEAAARDEVLSAFYRGRDFAGIWTGGEARDIARRNALLSSMSEAPVHGLGASRHDPRRLVALLQGARTPFDQGQAEVETSRAFLRLSGDLGRGMLKPSDVLTAIKREVIAADPLALISLLPSEEPVSFLRGLGPTSPEYARLLREKMRLEAVIAVGGWGAPAPAGEYESGESGSQVVALRDRLMALGYLPRTSTARQDEAMRAAIEAFQASHGLAIDGAVGESTLAEINVDAEARLRSVIVALERERWTAAPRGARHIWVNLADFSAAIVDDDVTTFRTRAVIGAPGDDRESPEFSEQMEFMVINPSWYVPRSIVVNEYLPQMRSNRNAAGHLRLIDRSGRSVDRGSVNFGAYSASSFPYSMMQPPGDGNALGKVKFMFPNIWNIYLHDTPSKDLFDRESRAFSHGCIRLADPFDFAHHLLARQTSDPDGYFDERLRTGAEARVDLDVPVPVHLDYRTAFTDVRGGLQFRRDVYGRDSVIWDALAAQGVEAVPVQG